MAKRSPFDLLFQSVDASTLALFRIVFGVLLCWSCQSIWASVEDRYLIPKCLFRYPGFEFLPAPSSLVAYSIVIVIGVSAAAVALGAFYRLAAIVLLVTYTYLFLLAETAYNNHYYLIVLLCGFFCVTDAHVRWSIDAFASRHQWRFWGGRIFSRRPGRRLGTGDVPYWQLLLFQLQFFIVYFYGGIAKINADWLHCEPMRNMLFLRSEAFPIDGLLTNEWVVHFFAYGGLLFDLSIGFLLFYRPTRLLAIVLVLFFHLTNNWLFQIGVFPWLGIGSTVLFLDPKSVGVRCDRWLMGHRPGGQVTPDYDAMACKCCSRRAVLSLVVIYFAIQTLVPFRHFCYPGNVSWTERGHKFAWHMKLRTKDGAFRFYVRDPKSGTDDTVPHDDYLTARQQKKVSIRPQLLLHFAHFLKDQYQQRGVENPEVYVDSVASLNGRPYQRLIDPHANLAEVDASIFGADEWIVPLVADAPIGDYPMTQEERIERMTAAILEAPTERERP